MSGSEVMDILALAHALIDAGWTQGAAVRRADGTFTGIHDTQATSYCLMGAVEASRATITARVETAPLAALIEGGPLYRLIGSVVRDHDSPFAFNDAPGRRKRDVLRVIERAAAKIGKS